MKPRPTFHIVELVLIVAAFSMPFLVGTLIYRDRARNMSAAMAGMIQESPMPDVEIATMSSAGPPDGTSLYRQPYAFTSDWFTANIPVWSKALAPYVGQPNVRYLEIGLYEGRSAFWMLEQVLTHPTSHLTGIDIFDGELRDRYLANLERSGVKDRTETIIEPSQTALRRMPLEHFDVIYIDGSHDQGHVLGDAVLSSRRSATSSNPFTTGFSSFCGSAPHNLPAARTPGNRKARTCHARRAKAAGD